MGNVAQAIVDLTPVTYTGKTVQSISEGVQTSVFNDPALNQFFRVVPGIKSKMQVLIFGMLGLAGRKKDMTTCAPQVNPNTIPVIPKLWDPTPIDDRFMQCWVTLWNTFLAWGLKNGIDKPDLTDTDWANFVEERVSEAELQGVWMQALFGSKNASFVGSGAGTQNVTDTGHYTIDYFNAVDGFWTQAFKIVAATGGAVSPQYTSIDRNAGANYAAQKFTAQDTEDQVITNVFASMVENADERLTSDPNVSFWVTKSVADQYKRERKANLYVEAAYQSIENGIAQLKYDGYTINILSVQDRMIRSYFNNGVKYDKPHRATFGIADNRQIGVENEADLDKLEIFYFPVDKNYYIDLLYTMDVMIVEDFKNQFAY